MPSNCDIHRDFKAVDPLPLPGDLHQRLQDCFEVHQARQKRRQMRLLWLLVGPGLLAMLGENDAPSMLSYAGTGSQFGINFFLPFILLTFVLAVITQEMTVRLGALTQSGLAELIYRRFGRKWGHLAMGDLLLTNFLTLITEFVGIVAGARYFHIPSALAVGGGMALVMAAPLSHRYFAWERRVLLIATFNLVFVPIALMSHPSWPVLTHAFISVSPQGGWSKHMILLALSDIGATITPWMLYFQQASIRDKGLMEPDIRHGRWDTVLGAGLASLAAVACLVATSVLFSHHMNTRQFNGAQFAEALTPYIGRIGGSLFALGILEAGLVAATTISTSSAYVWGESFRQAASLNRRWSEALGFYAILAGMTLAAGLVVLIPGFPLEMIVIFVNIIAVLTMPPIFLFLLILVNDRETMGSYRNTWWLNVLGIMVGGFISLAGVIYAVATML